MCKLTNREQLERQALAELDELRINWSETGRDREACYPSIEEEEEESLLEGVIAGCNEALKEYVLSKLHSKCRDCCKLDTICVGEEDKTKVLDCQLLGPTEEDIKTNMAYDDMVKELMDK